MTPNNTSFTHSPTHSTPPAPPLHSLGRKCPPRPPVVPHHPTRSMVTQGGDCRPPHFRCVPLGTCLSWHCGLHGSHLEPWQVLWTDTYPQYRRIDLHHSSPPRPARQTPGLRCHSRSPSSRPRQRDPQQNHAGPCLPGTTHRTGDPPPRSPRSRCS